MNRGGHDSAHKGNNKKSYTLINRIVIKSQLINPILTFHIVKVHMLSTETNKFDISISYI